jgi:regulator of sigma E protease
MGHFLIARWNGVRVEIFSVGFGREIFGWTDKHGTRWKFSMIPLGGYVKMFGDANAASMPGDDFEEMSPEEQAVAFQSKRLGQRAWIVAGGPLANFLFAAILFALMFMTIGKPVSEPVAGEVLAGSAAEKAGIQPGDLFLEIDGQAIKDFEDIPLLVQPRPGEALDVKLLRDGQEVVLSVTPDREELERFGNVYEVGRIGVRNTRGEFVRYGPFSALWLGALQTYEITAQTLIGLGRMISGSISSSEIGGPILIAQLSGEFASLGLADLLWFTAVISINLGLINLFPIPILDGGHLLFFAYEAVFRRPMGERAQEFGFRIGLALVLSLMVFATWNDLRRLEVFDFLINLVS